MLCVLMASIGCVRASTDSKALVMEIVMELEKKFKDQHEALTKSWETQKTALEEKIATLVAQETELEKRRTALEDEYKAKLDKAHQEWDMKEKKIYEAAQLMIKGKLEAMIAELKTKMDEASKTNEALLKAKFEAEKATLVAKFESEKSAVIAKEMEKAKLEAQQWAQETLQTWKQEATPQMEAALRAKVQEEHKAFLAAEEDRKVAEDLAAQKAQEAARIKDLEEQRKKGEVREGLFKGANSQNRCTEIHHIHYWKCESSKDKDCWKVLHKEFQNCLFVNVQEGENKYTEETKRLIKLGEDKSR